MSKYGRTWTDEHVAAGYHEQDFGPLPTADSDLIGEYQGFDGDKPITITVRFVPDGSTGPEFALQFGVPEGAQVTVVNEATVEEYLTLYRVASDVSDS